MIKQLLFGKRLTTGGTVILILLYLCTNPISTYAQEKTVIVKPAGITVRGKVLSDKGEEIPGVTIRVKGASQGTVTDVDGNYTIQVPAANTVLVFTYVSQTPQEVPVNSRSVVNVTMKNGVTDLSETVVVGYGTMSKAHLTGAVASIKAKEVEDLPVGNLGAALSGRILGLGVSGGTARPGSQATLIIRNPISLSKDAGSPGPLYVIDGVIQVTGDGKNDAEQFNNLDPSEVESISVLKDASAAIYGSRAANGVVIVTTKRGRAGVPKISYSGSYAVNDETYRTKMMSAYQFAQYMNIMNGPNGAGADPSNTDAFFSPDEVEHFKNINYDWLENAWSSASNMRHTLNVSGGSDRATFFASASYYTQDGNMSTLDYNKWTFRAGSDLTVASGLKVGLQLAGNFSDIKKTYNKVGGENDENDYRNLLLTPRYIPEYVDGYPVKIPGTNSLAGYHYYEIQRLANISDTKDKTLTINAYAEYEYPKLKGLKARVNYARYFTGSTGQQIGTKYLLYDFTRAGENSHIYDEGAVVKTPGASYDNGNRISYSNINGETEQLNFTLSYAHQFGKHNISGLFSVEKGEAYSNQQDVYREGPVAATASMGQFSGAFGIFDGKTISNESGTLGYIGRVNYNYSDKYLAEVLFRTDASTHFAPDNYWGRFYSVSGGWVISNESFFDVPAISYLKLRYSTGILGKDDTKAWLWRQRYTFQGSKGAVFGGNSNVSTGIKMEASPNPDAHWSNEFKNNLGLDARFLQNRLSLTLDGFYNKGTDLLMERTAAVPIPVGGSIAAENWGKVDFFGYEVGIGWNDNIGKDFSYGIDARFSWYDNKFKQGNFAATDAFYPWNKQINQSGDNGMWGYDYLGMFKNQGDIDNYVKQYGITSLFGKAPDELRPGMLYYRDVRGALQADGTFAGPDGIIDTNDQIKLAKKAENHYGFGFTLKANWKGIGFDCVIAGSFGGWAEIDARDQLDNAISKNYQSLPVIWGDIYDPVINPGGKMPNPNWSDISLAPVSNFWRVSAFRMGIRNMNLSYTLPKRVVQAMKITNARFALTALNPLQFFNPYSYRAPEGAYDTFPNLRTISLGVNLTL